MIIPYTRKGVLFSLGWPRDGGSTTVLRVSLFKVSKRLRATV